MDHFQVNDINAGVEEYQKTPNAKLIDVREEDEYAEGHIPVSINIPLSKIESAQGEITDLDTPLFVYCRSGNRSGQAVAWLKQATARLKTLAGLPIIAARLNKASNKKRTPITIRDRCPFCMFPLFKSHLAGVELVVEAALLDQVSVRSFFNNLAVL